jgi:hypothetical protein
MRRSRGLEIALIPGESELFEDEEIRTELGACLIDDRIIRHWRLETDQEEITKPPQDTN